MNALAKVNVFSALVLVEIGLRGGFSNIKILRFSTKKQMFKIRDL